MDAIRIDKWLWAARFFKTRALAQEAVTLGRVLVGGARAKPSRDVRVGDRLEIHRGDEVCTVFVEALMKERRPAAEAQRLYRETEESAAARAALREMKRIAQEPADTIRRGRPTKRDRREIERFREGF